MNERDGLVCSGSDWHARAAALRVPTQAFIDGRYVPAVDGATMPCHDPRNGQLLCEVAATGSADADHAVRSARRVFDRGVWADRSPSARKRVLLEFAAQIEAHAEELALLEALDSGKPITEALSADIPQAAECIAWYAEAIDKVYGEVAPSGAGCVGLITREPVGVVAAIVPWNFPLLMAAWKIAPALAAGNSVVLKPSEKTPLTALRVAALGLEAGLPPGVLNVLPGYGPAAGRALALHPDVDAIAFTGSTATGKAMLQYAGQSNLKRVWLECGGKSPNIVFADVPDLERAAETAATAIFYNQGQVCSAGSRLLLHESIAPAFIDALRRAALERRPGDPLDPSTRFGPLIDGAQYRSVMNHVTTAIHEGASLLTGGARALPESGGHYLEPTIFTDVSPSMLLARDEVFGPVLAVSTFSDDEQAVALANDSIYGLGAGIWTSDLRRAHRVAASLRSGSVWINCYDAGDLTMPFGGYRQSGHGRDRSLHAFDKYTELKATWVDLA